MNIIEKVKKTLIQEIEASIKKDKSSRRYS